MGLVKSRHPNGTVYVYSTSSVWDEEKGRSVTKRTLVGKVDPVSGQTVPTRKQNRKKGSPEPAPVEAGAVPAAAAEQDRRTQAEPVSQDQSLDECIAELEKENETLRAEIQQMKEQLDMIGQALRGMMDAVVKSLDACLDECAMDGTEAENP